MNNSTNPCSFRQEISYNKSEIFYFVEKIKRIAKSTSTGKRKSTAKVLSELFRRASYNQSLKVSQAALASAKKVQLTRETVARIIALLIQENVIRISYRHHRSSNEYELHPLFYNKTVRAMLKARFPELDDEKIKNHIEQQQKNKQYEYIIRENILYLKHANPKTISDLREEKISHSLKGYIYNNNSYEENARAPYQPFNFDGLDMDMDDKKDMDWDKENHKRGVIEPIFLIPDQKPIQDFIKNQIPDTDSKTQTKKVSMMKIHDLKSIKLTMYGQIRLAAFPEEVIRMIDNRMIHMKERPAKPWAYFVAACKKHCEKHGLPIDWTTMQKLAGHYNMPDDGPFVDESFIPVQIQTPKASGPRMANEEKMKQFDREAAERQQHRKAIEWEKIEQTDPERFKRWNKYAAQLRKEIGMNEDGTFISKEHEASAMNTLLPQPADILKEPSYNFYESVDDFDMDNGFEDYNDDPFGDRMN